MIELKPCPFCGGEAVMLYENTVICRKNCGALVQHADHPDSSEKTVVDAWNRRYELLDVQNSEVKK